jgi:hypothetical protein
MGPVGASWASVVATYFICVPYLIKAICSVLHVSVRELFPWTELLKLTATTIIPGIATFAVLAILPSPHFVRLAVASIVYGGLLSAILLWSRLIQISELVEMAKATLMSRSRKAL